MSRLVRFVCCLPILLLHLHVKEVNAKGICLYLSEKRASWFEALAVCQSYRMCLADLSTEVTLIQMEEKWNPDDHEYWFGLNSHEKFTYRYVSNNKSIEYAPRNSKLASEGQCAFVKHERGFYKFASADCFDHKRFICSRTEMCDGENLRHGVSHCSISEEEKQVVAL
ncbi:uncharacterized protein LOC108090656 [Drosophila ficusphila]|uniref:uncharacterized protein LOC108090656 n=1 Tax=Drosophila ficusphila TaxID=30025 RepID=UPI0007E74206|nr:uncharacterized protein LOC108090656 [Drosophila ficusphila]